MADPEFVARKRERDRQRAELEAKYHEEEKPILHDLREVGYTTLRSVWDFVNTDDSYAAAIPVLLKHLTLPYSDGIVEGIARALAVPEARHAWPLLVAEYQKTPTTRERSRYKDGLAVALSTTVMNETIGELITLAKDKTHGESRILLLRGIKRSKLPIAKQAIEELALDPQLAKAIAAWKRKKPKSN